MNQSRGLHRARSFDKCASNCPYLSYDTPCSSSNSSLALLKARSQLQESCSDINSENYTIESQNHLAVLKLEFSHDELAAYTSFRKVGLTKMSQHWINKPAEILWNVTNEEISQATLNSLRNYVLKKYTCKYAKRKVFNFTKAFLKYLTKTRLDVRYRAFELFLEQPKVPKERKNVTSRIVTKEDIGRVFRTITLAQEEGEIICGGRLVQSNRLHVKEESFAF